MTELKHLMWVLYHLSQLWFNPRFLSMTFTYWEVPVLNLTHDHLFQMSFLRVIFTDPAISPIQT